MVILGSTGSIGINALKVAKHFDLEIEALSCGSNVAMLNQQIKQFKPKFVAIENPAKLSALQPQDSKVFIGESGICEMLELCKSQRILNAVIGYAGLCFSLKILDLGKNIILANKESLVIAGGILKKKIQDSIATQLYAINVRNEKYPITIQRIFPIDSEHFSLYTLLCTNVLPHNVSLDSQTIINKYVHCKNFRKLYITASGGALRDFDSHTIPFANVHDVLKHPTWDMGKKITIDSATLVNKLYEILEAFWLFDTTNIDALIERSSLVHALVEFDDGTFDAHISYADMCLPIAYGLDSIKAKEFFSIQKLSIEELITICFQKIDTNRYPLWIYKDLLLEKPHLGVVLNAINEILQDLFLSQKIPFSYFATMIPQVLLHFECALCPQNMQEILSLREEVINLSNFLLKNTM